MFLNVYLFLFVEVLPVKLFCYYLLEEPIISCSHTTFQYHRKQKLFCVCNVGSSMTHFVRFVRF